MLMEKPAGELLDSKEVEVERRTFLQQIGTASLGALLIDAGSVPAQAQTSRRGAVSSGSGAGFQMETVHVGGNSIFFRRYGRGPAILMVHGFPRTSLMWRDLAPMLAQDHTVICVDLRAYGRSGTPQSSDDHVPYSKRVIAAELVAVMEKLGFTKFTVVGHDRGGRVSYRLALDHPAQIERLAVFDVIPISEAWDRADAKFAQTFWPWSLLAQKAPMPEHYLAGAPKAVFENPFGQGTFGSDILNEYLTTFGDPVRLHGICEEYRAAAADGIDVVQDHADQQAGKKINCPMLHLWAEGGSLEKLYNASGGPLAIWRKWAPAVQGQAMQGGHFFPEENPAGTAAALRNFMSA